MSKNQRGIWITIGGALVLAAFAYRAAILLRERPAPAPPRQVLPSQSAAPRETPEPIEDINVLIRIESTPPGAAIVRVSNKSVLGYTPETIQFLRSKEPVRLRLELEGFAPDMRDVPTTSDSVLSVTLIASPKLGPRLRTEQ